MARCVRPECPERLSRYGRWSLVNPGGYRPTVGVHFPAPHECEHCDGERSSLVRFDALRGYVCPPCDSSLDEMFDEHGRWVA